MVSAVAVAVYSSLESVTAMLYCARRMGFFFFFWGGGEGGCTRVRMGKKERKKKVRFCGGCWWWLWFGMQSISLYVCMME